MRIEIVNINAALARAWLATSKGNRSLRQQAVDALARAMVAGRFYLTHQGIAFDEEGHLSDGHHRLHGVITADKYSPGITITMVVSWGLAEEAKEVVDVGGIRTFPDHLGQKGYRNAAKLAAAARVHMWMGRPGWVGVKVYPQETIAWVKENPEIERVLPIAYRVGNHVRLHISVLAGVLAHAIQVGHSVETAERFVDSLTSGANLPANSPILALTRYLGNSAAAGEKWSTRTRRKLLSDLLVKVFNSWYEGREIKVLKPSLSDQGVPCIISPCDAQPPTPAKANPLAIDEASAIHAN